MSTLTKIFWIFSFTGISLSHILNILEVVGNNRVGLYWKAVKETTLKPCIFYIINLLLYIISWKFRLTYMGRSMHTCWVQEKSYKPACPWFFNMLLKRPWTRLINLIQKVCYFSWLHTRLSTEFPLLILIFIAFLLQIRMYNLSYLFPIWSIPFVLEQFWSCVRLMTTWCKIYSGDLQAHC